MSPKEISNVDIPSMPPLSRKILSHLLDYDWHQSSEIREYTKAARSTLTWYFQRLIEAGWIDRDEKRKGRRGTFYRLAPIKKITNDELREFHDTTVSPQYWKGPIGSMSTDINLYFSDYKRQWILVEKDLAQEVRKIKLIWLQNALWRYDKIVNQICINASASDQIILRGFFINYLDKWISFNNIPRNSLYNEIRKTIISFSDKKIKQQMQKMENDKKKLKTYVDKKGKNVAGAIAKIQSNRKTSYIESLDYALKTKDLQLSKKEIIKIKDILTLNEKIEKYLMGYWGEKKKGRDEKIARMPTILPQTSPLIILDSNKAKLHEVDIKRILV